MSGTELIDFHLAGDLPGWKSDQIIPLPMPPQRILRPC